MSHTYRFRPSGVCSQLMEITTDDAGTILSVSFTGGCNGNLQGIAQLIKGQRIDEVAERLAGIRCGGKATSCPDQLAIALRKIIAAQQGGND